MYKTATKTWVTGKATARAKATPNCFTLGNGKRKNVLGKGNGNNTL